MGMAAALAIKNNWVQNDLLKKENIELLQQQLLQTGHHIPGLKFNNHSNLAASAKVSASSELILNELPSDGPWITLVFSSAQMLPVSPGKLSELSFFVKAEVATSLDIELRISNKPLNYTPDVIIEKRSIDLLAGEQDITLQFDYHADQHRYVFVCFMKNTQVAVKSSNDLVSGLLTVYNKVNESVSNYGKQVPLQDIGVEEFEFWCPNRRPESKNFGIKIKPGIHLFGPQNINNGIFRPTTGPNSWIAAKKDTTPELKFEWNSIQSINEILIAFDTDYDHPMESSLMGHPESLMPYCVTHYRICNDRGEMVYEMNNNHQTINKIKFKEPLLTKKLVIEAFHPSANVQATIFEVVIS